MSVETAPLPAPAHVLRPAGARSPRTRVADVYVTCHGSVARWGGGRAVALHVQNAIESLGVTTQFVGIAADAGAPDTRAPSFDLPVHVPRAAWRLHNWLVPRAIAAALRQLPRPGRGLVAISAAWADAARRVWPDLPIIIPYCCSLTNCLPFAWPNRRSPSFWSWFDWRGVARAERRGFRAANRIVVPTQQARDELIALDASLRRTIDVQTFGYEQNPADNSVRTRIRAQLGVRPNDVLFLVGGVCDLNKSPDWIAREVERADRRAHLVVVGSGPVLVSIRASERVHLVGDHPNCDDWIAASDVVVSASWYDTLPNILKEAIAAGRPVLAPYSRPPHTYGGFDEIIHASGCGLCFERRADGALTATINRLVEDAALRESLAASAVRLASEQRGWSAAGCSVIEALGPADNQSGQGL